MTSPPAVRPPIALTPAGELEADPDTGHVLLDDLRRWHTVDACALICTDCDPGTCPGHFPANPLPGHVVVLGKRGTPNGRVAYRVTEVHPGTAAVTLTAAL